MPPILPRTVAGFMSLIMPARLSQWRPAARALCVAAFVAGCCTPAPPVHVTDLAPAQLPAGSFGVTSHRQAMQIVQNDWADAAHLYGQTTEATRAVGLMEYLAGSTAFDLPFSSQSRQQMLIARAEIRKAVGIAPAASSQLVVNRMAQAYAALKDGNQAGAHAALDSPVFTQGADGTLNVLANLPYIRDANTATSMATNEIENPLGDSGANIFRRY